MTEATESRAAADERRLREKKEGAPDAFVCVSPGCRLELGNSGHGRHILITAVSVIGSPLWSAVAAAAAARSLTLLFALLRHIIFENPPESERRCLEFG